MPADEGHNYSFGAPKGGWPTFTEGRRSRESEDVPQDVEIEPLPGWERLLEWDGDVAVFGGEDE